MTIDKGIFIRNIYYMLTYAFQELKQNNYEEIAGEEFEEIHDLFAEILLRGISFQLKQGLHKEYISCHGSLSTLKGKLDICGTVNNLMRKQQKIDCEYDELSENNKFNQILKTTVQFLLKHPKVKSNRKAALKRLMLFFSDVEVVDILTIDWTTMRFDRNCKTYRMLLYVCYFILDGMLMTTERGAYKMKEFSDEHMCRLYEKFVLEYYRKHYPELKAKATQIEHGKFELREKPEPEIVNSREAIVRVTLGSICTSDLHIKHGSVPRAVPGITVGHEMVGVVEKVGADVTSVKPGDRVTVNVETFCGECFFCRRGYVNNCTDPNGGWALGCRIDGGQAEYVRVPYADQGLNRIPDTVSDEQALFVGDVLATGFWATRISEISEDDTVLIIGAGPTGICTLLCVMLKKPRRIIVCEKSPERIRFVREHYPDVLVVEPENCKEFVIQNSEHGGADVVLEVAGSKDTFRLAWECARPNAVVTIVALYDEPQILPLPDMYGKNLIFKTGGVDGCDCAEILNLIEEGKIDTTPLITHRFPLNEIEEAYRIFENKLDGVIKVAIYQ